MNLRHGSIFYQGDVATLSKNGGKNRPEREFNRLENPNNRLDGPRIVVQAMAARYFNAAMCTSIIG